MSFLSFSNFNLYLVSFFVYIRFKNLSVTIRYTLIPLFRLTYSDYKALEINIMFDAATLLARLMSRKDH